jgi:hypothetical protein
MKWKRANRKYTATINEKNILNLTKWRNSSNEYLLLQEQQVE